MEKLIDTYTIQLKEALAIGEQISLSPITKPIQNIIICGLGGSGIGASLVQNILDQKINIPLVVNKTYTLPAFANENTLVIISSYSGNTEETLKAFEIAIEKKCTVISISSNGKVKELSEKNNIDFIEIPAGLPPRACLGYSSTQIFYILNFCKIIDSSFKSDFQNSILLLDKEKEEIKKIAKNLANNIINKTPILYSSDSFESVAIRFRQQINENSKMLAWHHAIPEMNHNELVGWRIKDESRAVIFLRNETDIERIQARMDLNKKIISQYTPNVFEIWSKGNSHIERAMYLINIGDWLSLYLSYLREVDTMEVKVIDFLKGELAKDKK